MSKVNISSEVVEHFLNGSDPQEYIVAVEANYHEPEVTLITNNPNDGKKTLKKHKYKPFLWFKHLVTEQLYGGKKIKIIDACNKFGVKITALKVNDDNGHIPKRMEDGYRYLATCSKSYNHLVNFFREGGLDVFNKEYSKLFMMFSPAEQFLIQTGKRLFKGMNDYDDLHRLQFDLETEGLFGNKHSIFQIGVRDNRGFETILEVTGSTPQARRDSERENILMFFKIIDMIRPDVITGFNSENFDWQFLTDRCNRLGIAIENYAITMDPESTIKRKDGMIKLGGESEPYKQTSMFGYNIIDICHSVRRAMAINSDIKEWNLKYITKYSEIAKPNRVYIPGNKIFKTWVDTDNQYAFNDNDGDWYLITNKRPIKDGYVVTTGAYIVRRYLLDDLWETEKVDNIFNQATFLIAKMIPTTYQRASTMGTSGQWKLIMAAWSYENKLAIPSTESKRDFTGGLSRLMAVGYSANVVKLDYAALYPKIQLTHGVFPPLDITGAMEGMLTYVVDTRDKFKFLADKEKQKIKELRNDLIKNKESYSDADIERINKEIIEHKELQNIYDKKQLPLKILANSWFGSYGAPYIFNWGETDYAEETTCRGRQYLRLMVKHFKETYGFEPLVLDTDGCNFAFPENINDIKYIAKGTHWKTAHNKDIELTGLDAVLAEFNEKYMFGRMGLDIDDICTSTINFSRKNYANLINGKIKLVGNSVKSKKMPKYIEDFMYDGTKMLLNGKGYDFINYYYEYVNKIYNFNIPLVKIASKAKVKISIADYKKKANQKNKAGNPMPKQAHMELAIRAGLELNQGDVIYYVNTGSIKSHGDLKSIKNKEAGTTEIQLNCKMIDNEMVENDSDLIKELAYLEKKVTDSNNLPENELEEIKNRIDEIHSSLATDEYNVAKYLAAFNAKVKPLLVCFHPDIRNKILIDIFKPKKPKKEKKPRRKKGEPIIEVEEVEFDSSYRLKERSVFTHDECKLVSGMPEKPNSQDDYVRDLMTMEDKEIKFWDSVKMIPNNMEESEWIQIRDDYFERMRIEKLEGIQNEKNLLEDLFKRLEVIDLNAIETQGILPIKIYVIADIDHNGEPYLVSRKWGEKLCHVNDMFTYYDTAKERHTYYESNQLLGIENRYDLWLDYKMENNILTGENDNKLENIKLDVIDEVKVIKKGKVKDEDEEIDEPDEDEDEVDEDSDKEEADDFDVDLLFNSYIDDMTPVHVDTRPNITIYPAHTPIVKQEPIITEKLEVKETLPPNVSVYIQKTDDKKNIETDEWGF